MTEKGKWQGELIAQTANTREIRVTYGESEHLIKFEYFQRSMFNKCRLIVDGEIVKLNRFLLKTRFKVKDGGTEYPGSVFFNRKWNFQIGYLIIVIDKQLVYMERNR